MALSGTPSPETLLPGNGHTMMRSLLQITFSKGRENGQNNTFRQPASQPR